MSLATKTFYQDRVGVNCKNASLVSCNRVIQTARNKLLFGKRRSFWFYFTRDRLSRIVDLGVLQNFMFEDVVYGFERWRESYQSKYVHLSKGDKHVFIRCFSRFEDEYRRFLRKRLKLLEFMVWDLKIELTIDPKKFFRLYDEFVFINRAWNKLRSWIRRRYGDFEFLRVLEITKNGRPHLHVLISGVKWIPQGELSDIWDKYGGGKIVYVKRVYNRNRLKTTAYVLKYVNKTLKNADRVYSALLFASNKRLFGLSRGCQNLIFLKKGSKVKKGFIYEGYVLKTEIMVYCRERGLKLADYLLISVPFEDYYLFPSLFGCEQNV